MSLRDNPSDDQAGPASNHAWDDQDLRIGTETWERYTKLIHLWAIYATNCRGSEQDGLAFVLRQAAHLQGLADFPNSIVSSAAQKLGRTRRHFGVPEWSREVHEQVARLVKFESKDSQLPTPVLLRIWRTAPPPLWRVVHRLPKRPAPTREAFDDVMELAGFIDTTYLSESTGLIAAADRVVAGYLAWARSMADLPEKLDKASRDAAQRFSGGLLGPTQERLDRIQVLLPDLSPWGRSTLARRFREIARPDLAVEITQQFDAKNPNHQYAVVARVAALSDLEEYSAAEADAGTVWTTTMSPAAAVMLSKIARLRHRDDENLTWALSAWDRERNEYTAQNLVTAALIRTPTGRGHDIQAAESLLRRPTSRQQVIRREEYVIVSAARLLFQEGRTEEARQAAESVLADHPEYFPAKQLLLDIRIHVGAA
jgi:hypothetical protein